MGPSQSATCLGTKVDLRSLNREAIRAVCCRGVVVRSVLGSGVLQRSVDWPPSLSIEESRCRNWQCGFKGWRGDHSKQRAFAGSTVPKLCVGHDLQLPCPIRTSAVVPVPKQPVLRLV